MTKPYPTSPDPQREDPVGSSPLRQAMARPSGERQAKRYGCLKMNARTVRDSFSKRYRFSKRVIRSERVRLVRLGIVRRSCPAIIGICNIRVFVRLRCTSSVSLKKCCPLPGLTQCAKHCWQREEPPSQPRVRMHPLQLSEGSHTVISIHGPHLNGESLLHTRDRTRYLIRLARAH